ncbi:2783_t:CDS:2, partial [Dentiscutata erythropus]
KMNQYLKRAVAEGYIDSIDYDSFSDIEEIKQTAKSEVFKAYWKHSGKIVALKTFDIFPVGNECSSYEEFIRKFQTTQVIEDNNIAEFYGQLNYFMILEYAKDGNLRDYLRQNFKNIDWKMKISIGKQIASGLKAIHDQNIAHKDLIKNNSEHEIPVKNTPSRYQLLYQQAWSFLPQERPSIEYINEELDEMLKNSKTSFFSKKPHDIFGKKPKNFVSSSVSSSPKETIIPPNIPKKPPDNLMNSDSNVDQLNPIQHQHYGRYELEEQQNLAFTKDPIQDLNKSTPFQQNRIHLKTHYNSVPIIQSQQSPHFQHSYYQSPPQQNYYNQGPLPQHGFLNQGQLLQQNYLNKVPSPQQGYINQGPLLQQGYINQEPSPQHGYLNQGPSPQHGYLSQGQLPQHGYLNQGQLHQQGFLRQGYYIGRPPPLSPKVSISDEFPTLSNISHQNMAQPGMHPQSIPISKDGEEFLKQSFYDNKLNTYEFQRYEKKQSLFVEKIKKVLKKYIEENPNQDLQGIELFNKNLPDDETLNENEISILHSILLKKEKEYKVAAIGSKEVLGVLGTMLKSALKECTSTEQLTEFIQQKLLKQNQREYLTDYLQKIEDEVSIHMQSGERRQCEICKNLTYAKGCCEYCIRSYLREHFKDWTSGNSVVDKIIQDCQQRTQQPYRVIEWIPFECFKFVKRLTENSIYIAFWNNGSFANWNIEKQLLERLGGHPVVLKILKDSDNYNSKWIRKILKEFVKKSPVESSQNENRLVVNPVGTSAHPNEDKRYVTQKYNFTPKDILRLENEQKNK